MLIHEPTSSGPWDKCWWNLHEPLSLPRPLQVGIITAKWHKEELRTITDIWSQNVGALFGVWP